MKTNLELCLCLIALGLLAACATPTAAPTILVPLSSPTTIRQPTVPPTRVSTATSLPIATPQTNLAPKKLTTTWQQRKSPRVLIDSDDVARIEQLATTQAWAKDALDQIIKNADAYPAKYLKDYNLASPDLPPSGGQWSLWYICPDGLRLQYQPTHTPTHYCPSTNQYFASPPQWNDRPRLYDEVIFARRHDDLANYARDLGLAYALTSDKKYAENAAQILRGYAKLYPTYVHHDTNGKQAKSGAKAHAQTLDEAVWLINIAWAYDLIGDTLSAADRDVVANNVLRPAVAEIQGNRAGMSNWQTWHNAAMAAAGFALGDEKFVNEAYNDPQQGFFKQLADGAANDGFWWEGSWGYHFFTLNAMIDLAEMGNRAGFDTFASPNLRALWSAPLQMAMPDLSLPRFNDDGGTAIARQWMYEIAYQRYRDPGFVLPISSKSRDWRGLLWGADTLPKINSSTNPSVLLSKAGYAVMRGGDNYLAFKFGPFGGWHAHFDQLGYVSSVFNRVLGLDPGTHSYASPLHNSWDKTTVAHNTIVVDEQNQGEASGNLHRYVALPALTLAIADAGKVYPNRAALTRALALNADYWLDVTRASSLDGKPHQFDWVYHNPGSLLISPVLAPYPLPKKNGYEQLANARGITANAGWNLTWDLTETGKDYGSVYRNNDDIKASFTVTRAVDCVCGQLDYDWGTGANAYAVYSTQSLTPPNETPTRMDVRIFGDGSNSKLTFRVMDATGEKFVKEIGVVSWTGWQTVTLNIDKSWSHSAGNNDGIIDLPVSQVAVQLSRAANSARAGRVVVDDIALTFPKTGRIIVEDFPEAQLQVKMLGAPETTMVLGNGIDQTNVPIPFAMARRNAKEATFTAVFEPYRSTPRIDKIEAMTVAPANQTTNAVRIIAPNAFTDSILMVDDPARTERMFGTFTTDASVAYVRQDKANSLHTLALADATKFSDGAQSLLTSSVPVTLQLSYSDDVLSIDATNMLVTQLRVSAQNTMRVTLNGNPVIARREQYDFLIDLH